MSGWSTLRASDLRGFSSETRALILEASDAGWVGRVSRKGHAILRAPSGSYTTAVPREPKAALRSLKNARAQIARGERERDL